MLKIKSERNEYINYLTVHTVLKIFETYEKIIMDNYKMIEQNTQEIFIKKERTVNNGKCCEDQSSIFYILCILITHSLFDV